MTTTPSATPDLIQRCREVREWHITGLLCDGALREYAKTMPVREEHSKLRLAEDKTAIDAMDALISLATPPAPTPSGARERIARDRIEEIAQWLHDETDHPEAYPQHTWPETERDDGMREGGFVKIVPLHAQAYFRDIARRLLTFLPDAAAIRAAAFEEAAKIAEAMPQLLPLSPKHVRGLRGSDVAAAIRAAGEK